MRKSSQGTSVKKRKAAVIDFEEERLEKGNIFKSALKYKSTDPKIGTRNCGMFTKLASQMRAPSDATHWNKSILNKEQESD